MTSRRPTSAPPVLDETRREKIAKGIRADVRASIEISAAQWTELQELLVAYHEDNRFWEGFLDRAQADAVRRVKERARDLRDAITALKGKEGVWFVQHGLETKWPPFEDVLLHLA